ncbi:MAG: glycosyltransferase family 1 protein [Rhodospirillales bacterium]|nr:MAG: glycosyltransferase family 1 protein [Rhodospirillales bacterium]
MALPRVLFIRNGRGITEVTGAETYLMTLMDGLTRVGCTVGLCCSVAPGRLDAPWLQALRTRGLRHEPVAVGSKLSLADVRAAHTHARAFGADVIHAMDHRSDLVAVMVGRLLRIPAVASFFGWTNWQPGSMRARIYPLFDRLAMLGLQRVIVDSRFIGETLGTAGKRLAVVPNGVDLNRFDPDRACTDLKRRWFGDEPVILVGMVGRIHPNKGQHEFARAASLLLQRRPETRFVVIGDAPSGYEDYLATLTRLIVEYGLEKRFKIINLPSAEIPDAMASLDVLAAPSYMESLSYVLLEAMAMRTPVVTSRVGGHGELITDSEDGLLIEPGDPEGLAAALERLVSNAELRRRLGLAGRKRVEAGYSTDAMVKRTLEIYSEVIAR